MAAAPKTRSFLAEVYQRDYEATYGYLLMAKEEHREDLLGEATGYVHRIEFVLPTHDQSVFVGFRECGSASVYWTHGDVLQFNVNNQLRRGFWQERMLACYKHKLHWLDKSEGRVRLERTEFQSHELKVFLSQASEWLSTIRAAIENDSVNVIGQIPADRDLKHDLLGWMS